MGAARAIGGGALGAIRAGASLGSAASTAYSLGQEGAASPSIAAGLGGVARAGGNAARERISSALGVGQAAEGGRAGAWNALNRTNSVGQDSSEADSRAPGWAQALRSEQAMRHRRHMAIQALREGDRGGAAATPDLDERDDR